MSERALDCVIVALDTAERNEFDRWCRFFGPRVGYLKVGLEAFIRWGPAAVDTARSQANGIFLDLKLHDIPNTVAGAVGAASDLGVDLLTVHVGGGRRMLEAGVSAARGRLKLLAVTALTHLDQAALRELDDPCDLADRVPAWAVLAASSGCSGAVCSPLEAGSIRRRVEADFLVVTPGVRPAGSPSGDQRRTATPSEARAAGADLLVVGRPLTRAADPELALQRLEEELASSRPVEGIVV
ncbi:MAG: orotidine-5'-phosphate decarboxylase [Thermoanaerobaculia bacterium]|nr:orotidine-5'-phosphate decarboxylase [Thermoanaerobaculia bacterium]